MTDSDDKLLQRYRALEREEPPQALDQAILAASRRALAPSRAHRWAGPVSIAAVLVLAFGVTLEMRREDPGIEYQAPAKPALPASLEPPAKPGLPTVPAPKLQREQAAPAPAPQREFDARAQRPAGESRQAAPQALKKIAPEAKEPRPFPDSFARPGEAPAAPAAPAAPPARVESFAASADKLQDANVSRAPAAMGSAPAAVAAPPPAMIAPRAKAERADSAPAAARALAAPDEAERELERIAKLREEGRNDEADKALEEFRRKHPDLRIVEPMWSRVKPR